SPGASEEGTPRGASNSGLKKNSNSKTREGGEDDKEHVISKIKDHRKQDSELEYLVGWQGYGLKHDSWEPKNSLHPGATKLLNSYKTANKLMIPPSKRSVQPHRSHKSKKIAKLTYTSTFCNISILSGRASAMTSANEGKHGGNDGPDGGGDDDNNDEGKDKHDGDDGGDDDEDDEGTEHWINSKAKQKSNQKAPQALPEESDPDSDRDKA
ncbi:hypothetical protein MJO29_014417, partial [Puccinia striiformis f. sp. tritici]